MLTESLSTEAKKKSQKKLDYFYDDLFFNYYLENYNNLSSKDLDKDFYQNLNILVEALSKFKSEKKELNDIEKKAFNDLLSGFIEIFMEQKINKELDSSFKKIFKF